MICFVILLFFQLRPDLAPRCKAISRVIVPECLPTLTLVKGDVDWRDRDQDEDQERD